jgi:hypothetical protein
VVLSSGNLIFFVKLSEASVAYRVVPGRKSRIQEPLTPPKNKYLTQELWVFLFLSDNKTTKDVVNKILKKGGNIIIRSGVGRCA